jgi:hypothetical protein
MFEIQQYLYTEHKPAFLRIAVKHVLRLIPSDTAFLKTFMISWSQEMSPYFMKT